MNEKHIKIQRAFEALLELGYHPIDAAMIVVMPLVIAPNRCSLCVHKISKEEIILFGKAAEEILKELE